jgi:hypothetical protein
MVAKFSFITTVKALKDFLNEVPDDAIIVCSRRLYQPGDNMRKALLNVVYDSCYHQIKHDEYATDAGDEFVGSPILMIENQPGWLKLR